MPSLIGTGPNQLPTNNLLGSLAFQDAENVRVESITYSGYLTGLGGFNVSNQSDVSGWIDSYGTGGSSSLVLSNGNGTSASNYSYIRFFNNKTSSQDWRVGTYNGDTFVIRDHTRSEFRFRIDTSGWSAFYMGGSTVYLGSGLVGDGTTNDSAIRWDASGALKICKVTTTIAQFVNTGDLELKTTGYLKLPEGTTAQRPASPQEGMIRKNSTLSVNETYLNGNWVVVPTLATDGTLNVTAGLKSKSYQTITRVISSGGSLSGLSSKEFTFVEPDADRTVISFTNLSLSGTGSLFIDFASVNGYGYVLDNLFLSQCKVVSSTASTTGIAGIGQGNFTIDSSISAASIFNGEITIKRLGDGSNVISGTIHKYDGTNFTTYTLVGMKLILSSGVVTKAKIYTDNTFDSGYTNCHSHFV